MTCATTPRPRRLPPLDADGNLYVPEYLLRRWEYRGAALSKLQGPETIIYTIAGRLFIYGGVRVAPRVTHRRRSFLQAVLKPVEVAK